MITSSNVYTVFFVLLNATSTTMCTASVDCNAWNWVLSINTFNSEESKIVKERIMNISLVYVDNSWIIFRQLTLKHAWDLRWRGIAYVCLILFSQVSASVLLAVIFLKMIGSPLLLQTTPCCSLLLKISTDCCVAKTEQGRLARLARFFFSNHLKSASYFLRYVELHFFLLLMSSHDDI